MLSKEFRNVCITGLACAVPNNKVDTDRYINYFGQETVEKFKKATGIESRYLSDGTQTTSDLCCAAAEQLMKKKGLAGDDIDALILVTQYEDYKIPSTAYVLHKRLHIKQDCLVFDINLGCSGFVNGIYIVAGLIESGTIKRALLLVGDADTNHQVSDDTSFTMMFGDAGSATILEWGEGTIRGMIRSDGEGFNTLITPIPGARFPGIYPEVNLNQEIKLEKKMDGNDVFLFAITKVPKLFKEFYSAFGTSAEDYDYIILHQANLMIINQIAKKLKVPAEKVPVSLTEYGNTDGASVPVGIVDLCGKLEGTRKLNLITSGFGIGLSWGVVSFEVNSDDVLPMIVTDDYFREGKDV